MRKKIEFERKALHIVEQLLEEDITEEFLRECVCVKLGNYYFCSFRSLNLCNMKLPCIVKIFDSQSLVAGSVLYNSYILK